MAARNYCYSKTLFRYYSSTWQPIVGLEIHAQINSDSKLFSGASTNFGKPVNTCVSFFDCATPGTLPVLNKKCVEAGVLTALALSCQLNQVSLFDRKHYFYADLPAGYQITQQRIPLAVSGSLKFNVFTPGIHKIPYNKTSKLQQIQLEQDSGKSLHDDKTNRSLVDLNRAGIPLMEFVFEPDLTDGEEAAALVKELIGILQALRTCTCKMEEGALRVDANISVHRKGEPFGVRTEVKNIASVRGVAGAVKYEIQRHIKALEQGKKIVNETLTWDAQKHKTISLREKERHLDYRFMPEPNLPPLRLDVNSFPLELPKLPEQIRQTLINDLGLPFQTAIAIDSDKLLLNLFHDVLRENGQRNPKKVANFILIELIQTLNKNQIKLNDMTITSKQIGELVDLLELEMINLATAMRILKILIKNSEQMPSEIVKKFGWTLINDDVTLKNLGQTILDENESLVIQYKRGKTKVLRAMLGEVVKKTDGCANIGKIMNILKELLK